MGAIADSFVSYVQPLIDQSDGSEEGLNKAFSLGQLCYNLALLPTHAREETLGKLKASMELDDEEFQQFKRSIFDPMIERHEQMFPQMHLRASMDISPISELMETRSSISNSNSSQASPSIDRYAPCPCGSGEKYKFCCGKKNR